MLLGTDLVDEDPTLLAVCNLGNDPSEFSGSAVLFATAAAMLVGTAFKSAAGVFSPDSQYVVIFPLPCPEKQ